MTMNYNVETFFKLHAYSSHAWEKNFETEFLSHSSKMIAEFLSTTLEIFNHIDFCQRHFFTKLSNLYCLQLNTAVKVRLRTVTKEALCK